MLTALLLFAMGCSVLNIAVFKGDTYTQMAVTQRTQDTEKERFIITDRNLIPLTGADERYDESYPAEHIIGYTDGSGEGVSGLELYIDENMAHLLSDNRVSLKDAKGNQIPNTSGKTQKRYVKLTLDYHIQKIGENVLDEAGIKGALVIADIKNGDILAMVSRPGFDRNRVGEYIEQNGTELMNRAVSPYNAGSIFKIITAAAALEEETVHEDTLFLCSGNTLIDGIDFVCHKREGHGFLTLEDAFALSCNCSFYNIGAGVGCEKLCSYAEEFGLGNRVLDGIISESKGNIPKDIKGTASEMANISIGQGEILITPLQAVQVVSIIASGGEKRNINIIDGIADENGDIVHSARKDETERIISESTANRIGNMMRMTTDIGTGTGAKSEVVTIAGKTGSAETGWQTGNGYMVQGWYAGYFPYEKPRYAMVIMTENGRQGNASCGPIFKKVAEEIMGLNY